MGSLMWNVLELIQRVVGYFHTLCATVTLAYLADREASVTDLPSSYLKKSVYQYLSRGVYTWEDLKNDRMTMKSLNP